MYFSLLCFALMLGLNLWLVPLIGIPDGYMGSAWAALISYFTVMVVSYFVGRHYYPLPYEIRRMGLYTLLALLLYFVGDTTRLFVPMWATYAMRLILLAIYVMTVARFERIPVLSRLVRRR